MTTLETVIEELNNKCHKLKHKYGPRYVPDLIVYLDQDFYNQCVRYMQKRLLQSANYNTILGYPIYAVALTPNRHKLFRIVNLDEEE